MKVLSELDKEALREHVRRRCGEIRARDDEFNKRDYFKLRDLAFIYDYAFFFKFEIPMFQAALDGKYEAMMVWDGTTPYLLRIYLTPTRDDVKTNDGAKKKKKRVSPFVHYFFRGDNERDVHNHPWWEALSIPFKNGYLEYVWNAMKQKLVAKRRFPFVPFFIWNSTFHRVEMDRGNCWTLFLAGQKLDLPEGEGWGFLDERTGQFETFNERDAKNKAKWAAEREHRLDLS